MSQERSSGQSPSLEATALGVLRHLVEQHSSARAVADTMGQAHNYVARILRGETKLRLDVLERILAALEVSESFFFELLTADRKLDPQEILVFFGQREKRSGDPACDALARWMRGASRLRRRRLRPSTDWVFVDPDCVDGAEAGSGSSPGRRSEIETFEALRLSDRPAADAGLVALVDGIFDELEVDAASGAGTPEEGSDRPLLERQPLEDLAMALATWSTVRRLDGRRADAFQGFRLALGIARLGESAAAEAMALHKAASLLRDWEQSRAALLFLDRAGDAYLRCGDTGACQRLFIDRAVVWVHLGDYLRAARDYEVGLRYLPAGSSSTYKIAALSGLSHCYREMGDLRRAILMNRAAESVFEGGRDLRLAYLVWNRGNLAATCRDPELAVETLLAAMDLLADFGDPLDVAFCSLDLAEVYMREGRIGEIRRLADRILAWLPALRGNRKADATMMEWIRCVKWGEINQALLETSRNRLESSKSRT